MPAFVATYITGKGRRRQERIEAIDQASLEVYLKRTRRVHPLDIKEVGTRTKKGTYRFKVPTAMLLAMLDSIEVLLSTGVPISVALRALVERTPPGKMRFMWAEVASRVELDGRLGPALRKFPRVFNQASCGMVEAGEATGHIDTAMGRVRKYINQIEDVQRAAQRAAFYPLTVVTFGCGSMAVLLLFTLPRFANMIKEMNVKNLNSLSAFFFGASDLVSRHTLLSGAIFLALPVLSYFAIRAPATRRLVDRVALKIPKIKTLVWSLALARICPTFEGLYNQGVSANECLPLCEKVAGNEVIAKRLAEVARLVRENVELGQAFERAGGFPMEFVLAVQHSSGKLDFVMKRMGDYYADMSKHQVEMALKIMEPILTVGVVGFAALSMVAMFLPLASVIQGLTG